MKVRFWGVWGSLPAPLSAREVRGKVREGARAASGRSFASEAELDAFVDSLPFPVAGTYGGNTSCVAIDVGHDEHLVCDAGSGLRELGRHVLAAHGPGSPRVYNLLMSHVHWDHLMGFPFFPPAYIPGNVIRIHGAHDVESVVREAFRRQQSAPCFPVEWDRLGASITFVPLEPGRATEIAGCAVTPVKQRHPGDSYGYRIEHGGKVCAYATDAEHKPETVGLDNPSIPLFREADLVIFDAMYTLAESVSVKEDWGHSSNLVGVELCQLARAKRLCLYHHDPIADDATLERLLGETRRFEELSRGAHRVEILSAYDGLELDL